MAFIVEMGRGSPSEPTFESYSCSETSWKQLLSIARTFGWKPQGTIPDESMAKRTKAYAQWFKPTYDPDEWAHCKRLSDVDAGSLSRALTKAHQAIRAGETVVVETTGPAIFRDDLTRAELDRVNTGSLHLIEGFARFALGGGFAFAWDD